jgi:tripartite-type tricarboxylate transporter receptor subunit TctC
MIMILSICLRHILVGMAGCLASVCVAQSQTFPAKSLRLVVPYAAGGAFDAFARPLAHKLGEQLRQPVLVENRPGGNSVIGADNVAKASADGHSLLLTSIVHYIGPFFSRSVPYDTVSDFTPIAAVGVAPQAIAVHPSLGVNTMQEFIQNAKANPGKIFYGTTGYGSQQHLGGILLARAAGLNIEHVPYKGGNPGINDVLAGSIPMVIISASSILPHAKAGRLRALAVLEKRRFRGAPELPTIGESIPGLYIPETWMGVLGPAGMSKAIVDRLNSELRGAVSAPEVRQRLENLGFEVTGSSADEFSQVIKSDLEIIRQVIQAAGIKPE